MSSSPLPDALDDLADVLKALGVDWRADKSSADLMQPDGYAAAMVEAVVRYLSNGSVHHPLPCPFCGGDALELDNGTAFCENCRACAVVSENGRQLEYDEIPEAAVEIYSVRAWNRRSEAEAPACPWCGASFEDALGMPENDVFYVVCQTCWGEGPQAGAADEAKKLWNRRA